jgi:hypothetical protein
VNAIADVAPRAKRRRDDESKHQQALIEWASLVALPVGITGVRPGDKVVDFLFAIPNGGGRSKAQAGILKSEGVKAGVWDLMLSLPIGRAPGLWIEMKSGKNTLTPEQRDWRQRMEAVGYRCAVCWSWDAAREAIEDYLSMARKPAGVLSGLEAHEPGNLVHAKDYAVRSPTYLRAVASLPCCNCEREGASQAAHLNRGKGMGIKASDNHTFPLCATVGGKVGCHEMYDQYKLGDKHASADMGEAWAVKTYDTLKRQRRVPMGVPRPKFQK